MINITKIIETVRANLISLIDSLTNKDYNLKNNSSDGDSGFDNVDPISYDPNNSENSRSNYTLDNPTIKKIDVSLTKLEKIVSDFNGVFTSEYGNASSEGGDDFLNMAKTFLYNPDNPKKSFDVYIDKNPKDTIPIKPIKNTIGTIIKKEIINPFLSVS